MENTLNVRPENGKSLPDFSAVSDSNWEVVVGSSDEELVALVKGIFIDDPQVSVKSFSDGCDLLICVARDIPDIVVLDDHLTGVSCRDIIRSIRRTDELRDIGIFCTLPSGAHGIDPECGMDCFVSINGLDKITATRTLNSRLYRSSIHSDRRRPPRRERRWPRVSLDVTARIEVLDPVYDIRYDAGIAQIVDLSREGAGIAKIRLKKRRIPDGAFCIRLRANHPPLEDWKADSMVARMNNGTSAGLKFVDISRQDIGKIMQLFE